MIWILVFYFIVISSALLILQLNYHVAGKASQKLKAYLIETAVEEVAPDLTAVDIRKIYRRVFLFKLFIFFVICTVEILLLVAGFPDLPISIPVRVTINPG